MCLWLMMSFSFENMCVDTSMSTSTCGQGHAGRWGFVVIAGVNFVVTFFYPIANKNVTTQSVNFDLLSHFSTL